MISPNKPLTWIHGLEVIRQVSTLYEHKGKKSDIPLNICSCSPLKPSSLTN